MSASEVLQAVGLPVETNCLDGLCSVCTGHYTAGMDGHRDHVLSATERQSCIILCSSRAAEPGGIITLVL